MNIASSLRDTISRGRLVPGEYLPSSRRLAADLGVSRQTVLVALDQLVAEGWVAPRPRSGFVVLDVPALPSARPPPSEPFQFRLNPALGQWPHVDLSRVRYRMHDATPDPTLLPRSELRNAYSFALRHASASVFEREAREGAHRLRRALVAYLRRVRAVVADDVVLTHGSQGAIAQLAAVLLRPGDVVVVEDPGYRPAWEAFRAVGAKVRSVAVDERGLDVDALRNVLRGRVRLLYTTPTRQYPTTVTLSSPRREALLELTRQRGIAVLEDDYDHEYCYRSSPIPPLACAAGMDHVLYVGTLSKLIAPGVRVGFVSAPPIVRERLLDWSRVTVAGGDAVTLAALSHFIEDGSLDRHVWRSRRVYEQRRDALVDALMKWCPQLRFTVPRGGLVLWATCDGLSSSLVARRALASGLSCVPESMVRVRGTDGPGLRLAFSRLPVEQAPAAAKTLARAVRHVARTHDP